MKKPRRHGSTSESYKSGDVGYGRPPRHSRFKPGQSGNPKGRPGRKASARASEQDFSKLLRKILKETLRLREGDRVITVSKMEAAVRSLTAKAVRGDTKAFILIHEYLAQHGGLLEPSSKPVEKLVVCFHGPDGIEVPFDDFQEYNEWKESQAQRRH